MSPGAPRLLKSKAVNGWYLFCLIAGPISIAMVAGMMRTELTSGPAVSSLIQLSVRCAVPWLYVAFTASSVQVLFPGSISLWLSRNRKYFGLSFAAAMAWQAFFILWMVTGYRDYYVNEVYVLRDAIEGVVGYLFLLAMTVTSFMPVRKHMTPTNWKRLHKSGIYFLWAYAFSVYWWSLFYYEDPVAIDYLYYWGGFLAMGLRIAAWGRKRRKRAAGSVQADGRQPLVTLMAYAVIAMGLLAAGAGLAWQEAAERYLTGYTFTRWPEAYLPYWPFEPFLPVFVIAAGTWLAVRGRNRQRDKAEAR